MKLRIIKNSTGEIQILCTNGTIKKSSNTLLTKLMFNFHKEKFINNLTGEEGQWTSMAFDMAEYPGETLAYVTDNLQIVFDSSELFKSLASSVYAESYEELKAQNEVNYIMIPEYARMHDRSEVMVRMFCRQGRIPGAKKNGVFWLIPENAPYPVPPTSRKK